MATMKDTTIADAAPVPRSASDFSDMLQTPHSDAFAFSETEALALELYDQLREVELQKSLIEAQRGGASCLRVFGSH
jgi:arylamine N-acetyltransferase